MSVWVPQVPRMVPYIHWSYGAIYEPLSPPFKILIFTVGVKSIAKMCFPCSTRSIKKAFPTEHGKHISDFCNTSAVKRMVSRWHLHHRGLTKMQKCGSCAAWEATKQKKYHRTWETYFDFGNPFNGKFTFLLGRTRFWPVLCRF